MYSSALKNVGASLLSATRSAIDEYKPTNKNIHGSFERIAQQGIANLSFRSPLLADVSQTLLHHFQLESSRKEALRDYIASPESSSLRKMVSEKHSDKNEKQIDWEMQKILTKINKSVDKVGVDETKKSDLFKEYESVLKDFITKEKTSKSETPVGSTSNQSGIGSPDILNKIEHNTLQTVNALEEIASKLNSGTGGGTSQPQQKNGASAFLDPYTGMPTIQAAVGAIGGKFLANVFDDDLINKYAKKAKRFLGEKDTEKEKDKPVQKENKSSERMEDVIKKTTDKIMPVLRPDFVPSDDPIESKHEAEFDDHKKHEEMVHLGNEKLNELKDINKKLKELVKISKKCCSKDSDTDNLVDEENKKKRGNLVKKGKEKLKSIRDKVTGRNKIPTTLEKVGEKVVTPETETVEKKDSPSKLKDAVDNLKNKVGEIPLSGAMRLAGSAALVAGAGYAGYQLGDKVVSPLIDKGISAATGEEGTTLGSKLYDWTTSKKPVEHAFKYTGGSRTKKLEDISKEVDTRKINLQNNPPPVIINAPTNNQSSNGGNPQPTIIVGGTVRNKDSTFERVQMQDFWSRVV